MMATIILLLCFLIFLIIMLGITVTKNQGGMIELLKDIITRQETMKNVNVSNADKNKAAIDYKLEEKYNI